MPPVASSAIYAQDVQRAARRGHGRRCSLASSGAARRAWRLRVCLHEGLDMTPAWEAALAEYAAWSIASGVSAGTRKVRRSYLTRLSEVLPDPWSATIDDLATFLAVPTWAPETRHSARAALRSFYSWAELTGRLEKDPSMRLPRVPVPSGAPRPAPTDILALALERADARGRLMVLLAAHAGLRRGEIAQVHRRDVVDGMLRVRGKGGKVRVVPLSQQLAEAIALSPEGYLFPGQENGHLSAGHVGKVLSRLLGPGWTAHTLRHRFATRGYAAERDLLAMQKLLGHAKPETTARYAAVPEPALMRAVQAAARDA